MRYIEGVINFCDFILQINTHKRIHICVQCAGHDGGVTVAFVYLQNEFLFNFIHFQDKILFGGNHSHACHVYNEHINTSNNNNNNISSLLYSCDMCALMPVLATHPNSAVHCQLCHQRVRG
jgi:hypothetical protein